MSWGWQEAYNSALLEKDADKLPERLVAAEKAILQRIQELSGTIEEVPEGRALREALDCLYARCPQEFHPPGQITDESEFRRTGSRWTRVATAIGLALFLLFVAGRVIERNDAGNEARRVGTVAGTYARRNPASAASAEPPENPSLGTIPHNGSNAPPAPSATNPHLSGRNPDLNVGAQNQDTERLPEAGVAATPDAPAANESGATVKNIGPRESAENSASSTANPTTPLTEENQNTLSSANTADANASATDAQENSPAKSEVPRGSVTISSSSYPSLRIPPELSSQASLSAASLQIGTPLSRPDPIYPEEAERQGIVGTVKLSVIIGKDGSVQNVEGISGPASLAAASVSAVKQWRYRPTFLGDQPVEVSEEVTIVFRIANPTTTGNSQVGLAR